MSFTHSTCVFPYTFVRFVTQKTLAFWKCVIHLTSIHIHARSTLKESVHRRFGPLQGMAYVQQRQNFSQHTGKIEHFFFLLNVLLSDHQSNDNKQKRKLMPDKQSSKHRRNLISEILLFYKRKL